MFCSVRQLRRATFASRRQMTPRPVQHGGGVELVPCSSRPEPPSVLRVRADCGGRLFTAKLGVVVHYLAHQLLNHLLADDAILLARQFCDCLRAHDVVGIDFASLLSYSSIVVPRAWGRSKR